jgi:hypothetical protein
MEILFYSPSDNESGDRVKQVLDELMPHGKVESHRQITGFVQRLRMPSSDLQILIFMPANRSELFAASSLLEEMQGIRLILILPDRENETLSMAHHLRPRFVTYANGDYSELKEVLKKMLKGTAKGMSA